MISSAHAGLTVYIVEDDAAMRDSLVLLLGMLDYHVASFASGEAFIEAYSEGWAGCVIADLKLPGMSGLELMAALRARKVGLPFVIITGHGDVNSARAAFQLEAVDFLEKPFPEAELRNAIEKGLDRESRRVERVDSNNVLGTNRVQLTRRQLEVLKLVSQGLHAKEIAQDTFNQLAHR